MNIQNINDKTKIFIRSTHGASIHFIGAVIWCLITDSKIVLKEKDKALFESTQINKFHNFEKFWHYGEYQNKFQNYTLETINLEESIHWMKKEVEFYPCKFDHYVAFIHAINPDSVMLAFENTRLINITYTEDDFDQMSFNWLIKTGLNNKLALKRNLVNVQNTYNKLKDINPDVLDSSTDLKFLTYINKLSANRGRAKLTNFQFAHHYPHFDIKFSDIMSGELVNQLTDLISFIGIDVSQERKDSVIKLINDYVAAQTLVPWKLDINDYK